MPQHQRAVLAARSSSASQPTADRWAGLLVASGEGQEACFALLADQVRDPLRSRAMRVLNDVDDADDVVQESLIEAWRKADSFDPRLGGAMSWLGVIVRCRAIDLVRRNAARRVREDQVVARSGLVAVDDTADSVLRAAESALVQAALPALTDLQRQAVRLVYYEDLTNGQAAERLGIPVPTLKSRLREAVRRLRSELVAPDADGRAAQRSVGCRSRSQSNGLTATRPTLPPPRTPTNAPATAPVDRVMVTAPTG